MLASRLATGAGRGWTPRLERALVFARALSHVSERLTKLVATIGPASETEQPLRECVASGMNVMRVNFSHATVEEFHLRQKNLRAAPGGEHVAIMLDTKGPEIRMGGLRVCKETGNRKAKVLMEAGKELLLTTDPKYDGMSDASIVYVGYPALQSKLTPGAKVLLDDGLVSLEVIAVNQEGVRCSILNTSEIGERKGVNLPGIVTDLPAMSAKDRQDIEFGVQHDIDMVAASFVRNGAGVREIREYLNECHNKHSPDPARTPLPLIIAKVESVEALENLHEIIAEADGVMVARGDLGVEIDLELVITKQKEMVADCIAVGKPVVVATQMLETMQRNPRPTRAEVADVTNAVLDQADAVMLSGESANGSYPALAVGTQASICLAAEQWARNVQYSSASFDSQTLEKLEDWPRPRLQDDLASLAAAANVLAEESHAAGIVVVEPSLEEIGDRDAQGALTRAVSQGSDSRPDVPIAALSTSLKVCRQLSISRGVRTACLPSLPDSPTAAAEQAVAAKLVPTGAPLVVLQGGCLKVVTLK